LHRGPRQPPDPEAEATLLIRVLSALVVIAFVIGLASATGIVMRQHTWWGVAQMAGAVLTLYTLWRIAAVRRQLRERRKR
jgi:hypothetical protein